ncbi:MAG: hypothetical protein ACOYU3_02255 [Bacillota bacterium]
MSNEKQLLKTIDAETLLSIPLEPVRFIVDRLLPSGLHLLGGSPKVGKGWLMLWLGLKVAIGQPLWEFPTRRCGLTLQFQNCVWRCIACQKPEEIAGREIPDFLFRLVDFISQLGEWNGCASELLAEMDDQETPANTVTKLLNQFHSTILAENGITYEYKRTGKGRSIRLIKGDGYDSCDSNIPTGKEPSLPSPTVTRVAVERGVGVSPTTHLACKV